MRNCFAALFLLPGVGLVLAQGPVVLQRGVVNAVTLEPAPSRVAPGDILDIQGLNLGPAERATADGLPLPTTLGGIQVLIANRPAPIFSVSPGAVRVQVPRETQAGLAPLIVQRNELRSRPVFVRVMGNAIGVVTKNGQAFGEAGLLEGSRLRLSVTGLGLTDPDVASGAADETATPRQPVRAFVGGLAAAATANLSGTRVGEFDVAVEIPDGAKPGDLVTITNGAAPVIRTVFGSSVAAVEVEYLRLPAALRDVRALRQSDLRGSFLLANGPRGADGCFPTWIFNFSKQSVTPVAPCLMAQANAVSAVSVLNESGVLAAFTGPAAEQQNLISSKLVLFDPAKAEPRGVDLPGPAAVLGSLADGSLLALGGAAQYAVNTDSGEVREVNGAGVGGGGGIGGVIPGGAGGGIVGGAAGLQIDLGDGLTVVLSAPTNLGQNMIGVVVGNEANKPARAKLALLNAAGAVTGTRDFPDGWAPLVPPAAAAAQPGAGGQGGAPFQALRLPVFFDNNPRSFYVLAKKTDGSAQGLVTFAGAQLNPGQIGFPEGWFAATCAPNFPFFSLELSRRVAVYGARRPYEEVLAACPARGYLSFDLGTQSFNAITFPGVGEANTRAASGEVNDFLFAANTDAQNAALSDTLYIYDSVAGSPFRLDLPAGIVGFQQIVPVAQLNMLVATATGARVAGDGGLVIFDLESEKTTVLPVPEGFTTMGFVGVFANTRKLIARGVKPTGTQYLIYDLTDGNLVIPPNPEGVAFVGALPAVAGQPGQPGGQPGGGGVPGQPQVQVQAQLVNAKANSIAALAYDAGRNLVGIVHIKVP